MFQISFISLYFRTQAFRLARKIRKSLKLNLPELCKMFEYIFFICIDYDRTHQTKQNLHCVLERSLPTRCRRCMRQVKTLIILYQRYLRPSSEYSLLY